MLSNYYYLTILSIKHKLPNAASSFAGRCFTARIDFSITESLSHPTCKDLRYKQLPHVTSLSTPAVQPRQGDRHTSPSPGPTPSRGCQPLRAGNQVQLSQHKALRTLAPLCSSQPSLSLPLPVERTVLLLLQAGYDSKGQTTVCLSQDLLLHWVCWSD